MERGGDKTLVCSSVDVLPWTHTAMLGIGEEDGMPLAASILLASKQWHEMTITGAKGKATFALPKK